MASDDSVLAALSGFSGGIRDVVVPYLQARYKNSLEIERQKQEAENTAQAHITEAGGAAKAVLPSQLALEGAKTKLKGYELPPKMQAAMGLDPANADQMNKSYDERTIMPMMHYLAVKESMGNREKLNTISGKDLKILRPDLADQLDDSQQYPKTLVTSLAGQEKAKTDVKAKLDIANQTAAVKASQTGILPSIRNSLFGPPKVPQVGAPSLPQTTTPSVTPAQLKKLKMLGVQ